MSNTKKLTLCAMMVALATALAVLSMFIPLQLPMGGSVTFASMLPIVLVAYMLGTKWGLAAGFVFAVIQMLLGASTVASFFMPGDSQMLWWRAVIVCLFDYILAYTLIGFSGILRGRIKNASVALSLGAVIGLTLRYLCHIVSGAVFFGGWAEWFFTDVMPDLGQWLLPRFSGASLSLIYSIVYNGLYMIPELVLTAVLAAVVPLFMKKLIRPLD